MSVNVRLWRPAAQRGVRNGFSMIEGARLKWEEASSRGLAAATGIVNAHLSGRYLGQWDLGVLSDLEGIRECAAKKLQWQQGTYAEKLQDALEDLVASLASMDEAAASIRMYVNEIDTPSKGSPSPLGENRNENVIPVYGALPLSAFENWARETVDMFHRELKVKRRLVDAFHALVFGCNPNPEATEDSGSDGNESDDHSYNKDENDGNLHADEDGEEDEDEVDEEEEGGEDDDDIDDEEDLTESTENRQKRGAGMGRKGSERICTGDGTGGGRCGSSARARQQAHEPIDRRALQLYLTAWMAEPEVNKRRLEDIVAMVKEEMHTV